MKFRYLLPLILSTALSAQVTPSPISAYVNSGSGWAPWTSAGNFGAVAVQPPPYALYCQASAGAAWTPCNPSGSGGGSSTTVENVFTGAGTINYTHSLGTPNPLATCYAKSGATAYTLAEVDNDNIAVTVPGASDLVCAFAFAPPPPADFNFALTGIPGTFVPALSTTQTLPITVTQTPSGGFSASTTYSLSGLPSGLTGSFSPNPITGGTGTSTLTMGFPYNQASGANAFTVTGAGGSKTHSQNPSINIATTNNGLVEGWPLNEGSGSTLHTITSSGNNLTGTAITWTTPTGFPVPVATFNGTTSQAIGANNTNTNFNGSTPFSVCGWVKFSAYGVNAALISTLDTSNNLLGWELVKDTNDSLIFLLVNNISGNFAGISTGLGHVFSGSAAQQYCLTYDGSKTAAGMKIYMGGALTAPTVVSDTLTGSTANTRPVLLGNRMDNSIPINGSEGFIRIYNRVLISGEVSTLFTAGPQ